MEVNERWIRKSVEISSGYGDDASRSTWRTWQTRALKFAPLGGAEIDGTANPAKECPSIGAHQTVQKSMTILLIIKNFQKSESCQNY